MYPKYVLRSKYILRKGWEVSLYSAHVELMSLRKTHETYKNLMRIKNDNLHKTKILAKKKQKQSFTLAHFVQHKQ